MADLSLAIAHHILVFGLAAMLAVELALLRDATAPGVIARLARIDAGYGGVALAVILVGIARVLFGVRGWEYYVFYPVFWMKMATFIAIAALSVPPTLAFREWSRMARDGASPTPAEIARVRRWLVAQVILFALLLAFAAAMARGVGY